jgi:hypothetical protein
VNSEQEATAAHKWLGIGQMKTVILPKEKVAEARDNVIASLNSGSRWE